MRHYLKVGVVELVGNVPAEHEELPSLEEHRVEEAQREQQLLVPVQRKQSHIKSIRYMSIACLLRIILNEIPAFLFDIDRKQF